MIDVGLFDSTFFEVSSSLRGERSSEIPAHIHWVRERYLPITFFTDIRLHEVENCPEGVIKVAWLIEPRCWSNSAYQYAENNEYRFDYILSHESHHGDKWLWIPLSGSMIKDFGVFEKTKRISMFTTDKRRTSGHILRADLQDYFQRHKVFVELFGRGSYPVESKATGLREYKYSIVIEPCKTMGLFTEKLIDCFSQGTIPIYWGAPDIENYFDERGIIQFSSAHIDDLLALIQSINRGDNPADGYQHINLEKCRKYISIEDFAFEEYPFIFK